MVSALPCGVFLHKNAALHVQSSPSCLNVVTLRWNSFQCRRRSNTPIGTSCYRNGPKLWPCGPLLRQIVVKSIPGSRKHSENHALVGRTSPLRLPPPPPQGWFLPVSVRLSPRPSRPIRFGDVTEATEAK